MESLRKWLLSRWRKEDVAGMNKSGVPLYGMVLFRKLVSLLWGRFCCCCYLRSLPEIELTACSVIMATKTSVELSEVLCRGANPVLSSNPIFIFHDAKIAAKIGTRIKLCTVLFPRGCCQIALSRAFRSNQNRIPITFLVLVRSV